MRHLFNSTLSVYRLVRTQNKGAATVEWRATGITFDARLDLTFVRPGKDSVPPAEAGKAPDRNGLLIYSNDTILRASDRLKVLEGPHTPGWFEIRAIPDPAQGYSNAHHMEVQVFEVAQQVATV